MFFTSENKWVRLFIRYLVQGNDLDNPYEKIVAKHAELFIEKYGFPSERLVGPTIVGDTVLKLSKFTLLVGRRCELFNEETIDRLLDDVAVGKMHNMDLYFLRNKLVAYKWDSPYIRYKCDIYKAKLVRSDFFDMLPQKLCLPTYSHYSNAMYYNLTQNQFGFVFKVFDVIMESFKNTASEEDFLSNYFKMPLPKLDCKI